MIFFRISTRNITATGFFVFVPIRNAYRKGYNLLLIRAAAIFVTLVFNLSKEEGNFSAIIVNFWGLLAYFKRDTTSTFSVLILVHYTYIFV